MTIRKAFLRVVAGLISGWLALFCFSAGLTSLAWAASLAQGYHSAQSLSVGTVVSLTHTGGNEVQTTDTTNEDLMLGVAVDSTNAIVDLQPTGSDVRVAISGESPVLVSDVNGDIKAGDSLIISQIVGVAMKDDNNNSASKYIGVASEDFNSKSSTAKEASIKQDEADRKVHVGLIKAKILLSSRKGNSKQNPVTTFVQKIVGKPVGTAQVVGALAVFLTTFVFTGLLLNGSIKGSFVSIGRNPLSKPSIISNMIRVSVICLIVLVAGVAMGYAILLI